MHVQATGGTDCGGFGARETRIQLRTPVAGQYVNGQFTISEPSTCRYAIDLYLASCQLCPVGTDRPLYGMVCEPCPRNRYKDVVGRVATRDQPQACTACPAGTDTQSTTGSTICTSCPVNMYTNYPVLGELSGCTACAAGSDTRGNFGSTTCTLCAAGTYSFAGLSACTDCAVGKFSAAPGAAACIDCTAGRYSTQTGADAQSVCIDCAAGTYSGAGQGTACIDCVAGKYATASGTSAIAQSVCIDCPAGTYSGAGQGTACIDCVAGKYATASGTSAIAQSVCIDCVAGKWSASGQGTACIECPAGKYSTQSGTNANAASVCIDCAAGKYLTQVGTNENAPRVSDFPDYSRTNYIQISWAGGNGCAGDQNAASAGSKCATVSTSGDQMRSRTCDAGNDLQMFRVEVLEGLDFTAANFVGMVVGDIRLHSKTDDSNCLGWIGGGECGRYLLEACVAEPGALDDQVFHLSVFSDDTNDANVFNWGAQTVPLAALAYTLPYMCCSRRRCCGWQRGEIDGRWMQIAAPVCPKATRLGTVATTGTKQNAGR